MPAPTLIAGAPCWIDLFTSDPDLATRFYGGVLGWTPAAADPRFGGYFTFTVHGKHVAGCMRNDGTAGTPDTWTVYLASDDAERTAADAAAGGGRVLVPPMRVEENGTMALVADPGGAAIGVWQADAVHGFELRDEAGAAAWFELLTTDYDTALAFYRRVFGWEPRTVSDTPGFRYSTLGAGADSRLAGIMDATGHVPPGTPATWSVYFAVTDADAALQRARDLGGRVIRPAEDTPYGRLASVADPTGAPFRIIGDR